MPLHQNFWPRALSLFRRPPIADCRIADDDAPGLCYHEHQTGFIGHANAHAILSVTNMMEPHLRFTPTCRSFQSRHGDAASPPSIYRHMIGRRHVTPAQLEARRWRPPATMPASCATYYSRQRRRGATAFRAARHFTPLSNTHTPCRRSLSPHDIIHILPAFSTSYRTLEMPSRQSAFHAHPISESER